MSIFGKAFVSLGLADADSNDNTPKTAPVATPVATAPVTPAPTVPVTLSSDDGEFVKIIEDYLKNASNLPADFHKFRVSVESLTSIIPDEMTRFKTAFATMSATASLTVSDLLTSSENFFKVLENESKDFAGYIEQATAEKVTTKENQVAKILEDKASKLVEIQKLTDAMNALTETELAIKNEIESAKSEIKIKENNFASALYKEKVKLENTKANIEKYLKEAK